MTKTNKNKKKQVAKREVMCPLKKDSSTMGDTAISHHPTINYMPQSSSTPQWNEEQMRYYQSEWQQQQQAAAATRYHLPQNGMYYDNMVGTWRPIQHHGIPMSMSMGYAPTQDSYAETVQSFPVDNAYPQGYYHPHIPPPYMYYHSHPHPHEASTMIGSAGVAYQFNPAFMVPSHPPSAIRLPLDNSQRRRRTREADPAGDILVERTARRRRFRGAMQGGNPDIRVDMPKGISAARNSFRVQVQVDLSGSTTAPIAKRTKYRFSNNLTSFDEALWMYEIVILFSDKPATLDELISITNYDVMMQRENIDSKEDYYAKLGKKVSEFAKNECSGRRKFEDEARLAVEAYDSMIYCGFSLKQTGHTCHDFSAEGSMTDHTAALSPVRDRSDSSSSSTNSELGTESVSSRSEPPNPNDLNSEGNK